MSGRRRTRASGAGLPAHVMFHELTSRVIEEVARLTAQISLWPTMQGPLGPARARATS